MGNESNFLPTVPSPKRPRGRPRKDAVKEPLPGPLAPLLEAFVHYLRAERGSSENTIAAYFSDLTHFVRWAHAGGVADFRQPKLPEFRDYLAHLDAGDLSAASRGRQVASLRAFFRFLALEEEASLNASELLEAPRLPERLPGTLWQADVEKLLAAPRESDRYGLRNRALLESYYALGARASEVIDLRLIDMDLDGACCRLRGKGNKERLALLGRPAVAAIHAYLDRMRPDLVRRNPTAEWVFVSRIGRRLTRDMIWRIVRFYAQRAGFPTGKVHPHTLRHAFASHMLAGGADIRVVQELLGHASINATMRYLHVTPERLQEVHAKYHPRGRDASQGPAPE